MTGLNFLKLRRKSTIYKFIENNTFNIFDNYNVYKILQLIPNINLGRAAGHSTAIKEYIIDNPNLNFVILGLTQYEYNDKFGRLKNATRVNIANKSMGLMGRKLDFDYIIIDNFQSFSMIYDNKANIFQEFIFRVLTSNSHKNVKIVGLG